MKKITAIFITLMLTAVFLVGCNEDKKAGLNPIEDSEISKEDTIEQSLEDENDSDIKMPEETDENESKETDENEPEETGVISAAILRFDKENANDETLRKSLATTVNGPEEEQAFLDMFFSADSNVMVADYKKSKIHSVYEDDSLKMVIFKEDANGGYPKSAVGFIFAAEDMKIVGSYTPSKSGDSFYDDIKLDDEREQYGDGSFLNPIPLNDYYVVEYEKDDNGKRIKANYSCDPSAYGTYNSSGTVLYDDYDQAIYRSFYYTAGDMIGYYFYDENGMLFQYLEFGGAPYTGLSENPDIFAGIDATMYYFKKQYTE